MAGFTLDLLQWRYIPEQGSKSVSSRQAAMNRFLSGVEKRAFTMTRIAVSSNDDALDIVQSSMMQLVEKYGHKPEQEWAPIFYRILRNRTTDFYRQNAKWRRLFTSTNNFRNPDGETVDVTEIFSGRHSDQPEQRNALDAAGAELNDSLTALPRRQQQAFLLRAFEGMSVADTAKAMRCSQGSVKTHYSRAIHRLRDLLGEHWP